MTAPLPKSLAAPLQLPPAAHTGLWFDKFCNRWPVNPDENRLDAWSLKSFTRGQGKDKEEINPKLDWIKTVTDKKVGDEKLLVEHTTRLSALAQTSGGKAVFYKTAGRFATGLGRDRDLNPPPRTFRQEHGLLNHQVGHAMLSGAKHLLCGGQRLFDIGRSRRNR